MDTELPGAAIALAVIRMISESGLDRDDYYITYNTSKWNGESRKFEDAPPHFTTSLDCSDTFFWGSADAEEVTEENLHILEEVLAELVPRYKEAWRRLRGPEGEAQKVRHHEAYERWKAEHPEDRDEHGNTPGWIKSAELRAVSADDIHPHQFAPVGDLFAARVRGERPQGAAYKVRYHESLWPLFNECGPERETGFGNPKRIGE